MSQGSNFQMKLFLDSANLNQIRKFLEMGVIDGVTTNPTLLAKEQTDPAEQIEKILKMCPGPVNIEVLSTEYEGMVKEARIISQLGENAVVKIPMTPSGIRAVRTLSQENIKTNVTLLFSLNQAILAAKAGASYVSPFIGRLDDVGYQGISLIKEIVCVFRNYSFSTKVLVSSVRHPLHVIKAAKIGADVCTVPPDVLEKMLYHPLSDIGLKRFLEDWSALSKQLGRPIFPFKEKNFNN